MSAVQSNDLRTAAISDLPTILRIAESHGQLQRTEDADLRHETGAIYEAGLHDRPSGRASSDTNI